MFSTNYFAANFYAPSYFPRNSGAPVPLAAAFGGWPRGREDWPRGIKGYQDELIDGLTEGLEDEEIVAPPKPKEDNKAKNIAIIRQLRAELELEEDTERRRDLRRRIDAARKEKERLFALEAAEDESESEFILFN